MAKYWGKQIFTHGSFPEVGQKQKTERERERKKDQKLVITATHCKRHLGWHTQAAWANKLSRALNVTSRTFNSPEYYKMLEDAIYQKAFGAS